MIVGIGILSSVLGMTTGCSVSLVPDRESSVSQERVAFPDQAMAYVQDNHIWVAGADGTDARRLTVLNSQAELSPVWSSDRTQLLFVAQTTDAYFEIRSYDSVTGQVTTLIAGRDQPYALQPSPNGVHVMYQTGSNLYILDLVTLERTRIHEGVRSAAWSFTGKEFVFATDDDRLLFQDYTLKGELSDPVTLLEQAVSAPVFTKAHELALETEWEGEVTAVIYNIQTEEIKPISTLRFTSLEHATQLILEPLGTRVLYLRTDEITQLPNIWVIDTEHSEPQLILTNAGHAVWAQQPDSIYYVVEKGDLDDNLVRTVYTATAAGLQKSELVTSADSVVSATTVHSNEYK